MTGTGFSLQNNWWQLNQRFF